MAEKIVWSPKAQRKFIKIISWLQENWSEREVSNFITRIDEVLNNVSISPKSYRKSSNGRAHEVVINKYTILLYQSKRNHIELLTFYDTRQNPAKKFK